MLGEIIKVLNCKGIHSIAEMSDVIGISPDMTLTILLDLERMGVLKKLPQGEACNGRCMGCPGCCGNNMKSGLWELTEKYRRDDKPSL